MKLAEVNAYTRLPIDVVGAKGSELILRDGRRVLDLYGGHCVLSLGAGNPRLGEALASQWRDLAFVTNLLDHGPRHRFLAAFEKNLPAFSGRAAAAEAPSAEWRIFCSNSGAEANENALKTAFAATGREKVVAFSGAFHGRTAAAAAVTDGSKRPTPHAPFTVVRVPFGDSDAAVAAIDSSVAAVILEPIQSLAGVVAPPPGFLAALRKACDASGSALIFDEVQTGNGRLGTPWASQFYGIVPDVFTTAKGAAGGVPIGLTVIRGDWAERVPGALFGSTFGGGPLPLALAAIVAETIASEGFLENVRAAGDAFRRQCRVGPVARVRGEGLLLGLELQPGVDAKKLRNLLLEEGVLVGTCDDPRVLRLCPALTIGPQSATVLEKAIEACVPRLAVCDGATVGSVR